MDFLQNCIILAIIFESSRFKMFDVRTVQQQNNNTNLMTQPLENLMAK